MPRHDYSEQVLNTLKTCIGKANGLTVEELAQYVTGETGEGAKRDMRNVAMPDLYGQLGLPINDSDFQGKTGTDQ